MNARAWFDRLLEEFEGDPAFMAEEVVLDITCALNKAMKEQGLTRKDLAARMGTSPAFISGVLNGKPNMTLLTLCKFATALGLRPAVTLQPEVKPKVERPRSRRTGVTRAQRRMKLAVATGK